MMFVSIGGEGAALGGALSSEQTTDTSGAQKTSPAAPVSMATMMMGGKEEVVAAPNGRTPPTNDSYVHYNMILSKI